MRLQLLLFLLLVNTTFAQLGTVTDLHAPRTPCPTGFTCGNYTVTTPYTPLIRGYAAVLEPTVSVTATNLYFSGAGGTGPWQGPPVTTPIVQSFWDAQSAAGQRIIQWAWSSTWSIAIFNGTPVYNRLCSDRAATVIDFFQHRYSGDFRVIGGSWGAGEVAFSIANWPINVNRALFTGGPVEMNIAEGCESTDHNDPYWYNPGTAGGVDLFMGLMATRPCFNRDSGYDQLWHENSVEFGGVYSYPNTRIYIYVGANDSTDIKNRGGFYRDLLQQSGQTDLQFTVVPNCGHEPTTCASYLTALLTGLLP